MIKITNQEFTKRFDALPEGLRERFLADENVNMLSAIGEAHHLHEDRIQKVAGVVGYVVLGLVHAEELAKEIAIEAEIDKRLAEEIAHEIQLKILNPLMPEINAAFNHRAAEPPAAAPTPSAPPSKPTFAEPPTENQPFILHEESDLRQGFGGQAGSKQARPQDETLMRPVFYDPPSRGASEGRGGPGLRQDYGRRAGSEPPTAARLEIGGVEEIPRGEPRVGKTEEPPMRVVHYTGPQTPVDPFRGQTPETEHQISETGERKAEPPKDIHPENIVDLKDLPK